MTRPLVGLLDCNNFYVSCERVFRPDLQKRPVVVLSNNDGCVIARSNEVKALGVPMGAPYFKVRQLLEENKVVIFSSNFSLYGDISTRVMSIVESLVPRLEVYSIDEVFIDFTGVSDPYALAKHIRKQVLQQVGIPTCLGISQTKTLAKVANWGAKKIQSYEGICFLETPIQIDQLLCQMPLRDVWGIGRKSAEKLTASRVATALDLKRVDAKWMRRHFTVVGERLVYELNGVSCLQIDDIVEPRKSMQVTRTFAYGITDYQLLREKIVGFATRIAEKLRQQQLTTKTVSVFVRTNYHKKEVLQYKNSASCSLPFLVNDDMTLIKACTKLFNEIYRPGFSFHKAGVSVHDLADAQENRSVQLSLFEEIEMPQPKVAALMKSIDVLNQKFGKGTLRMASCGGMKRRGDSTVSPLQGHQLRRSPAYTTRWTDLPVVT